MSQPQQQIFISYQRADSEFARQVREHLTAHGVKTWMDQYDIPVGAYWPDEIDKGLTASDIVVGLLSPDAVASRNVKNEWDWAIAHDRRLLLLHVTPCDVPHRYISINFIDATGADREPPFSALLQTLGVVAQTSEQNDAASTPIATRHGGRSGVARQRVQPLVVGREHEQALLNRQLEELAAGRGSLVLIGGEAGIGKTTLTRWLAWAAQEQGAVALTGGCYDLSTTPPYGPWVEITRGWPVDERGFPDVPPELRGGDGLARVHSQAALFEIVADFFAAASAVRPLVLLLEDMHWTDQASLDLLRYLARSIAEQRLMLVITYRDDELTRRHPLQQVLPSLIREANAQRMSLPRLGRDGVGALIASRYALSDTDLDRTTSYVERVTEGNPFFAGEVLRALEETGALRRADEIWQVSGLDEVRVPELVRQVIDGRLERLGDDARRLLEIAAAIGHEVDIDLWIEISGADEAALVDVLERAIEARLVEELPGGARLRFTHALVRETLYADLVSIRRRAWHRQIGEALANRPNPDPDAVASHYQQAADPRAVGWLVQAGERAQRAYAWITAIERYEAALLLLNAAGGDERERGWLQYRIARLRRFWNPREAFAYLDEATRIAAGMDDRALAAAARYTRGLCAFYINDYPAAIANLSAGADMLEALPAEEQLRLDLGADEDGVPTITNPRGFLVVVLSITGRLTEALQMGEATREGTPKQTPLGELGWSHHGDRYGGLGMVYTLLGRVDEARAAYEQARTTFRATGHSSTEAIATQMELVMVSLPYRTEQLTEHEQLVEAIVTAGGRATGVNIAGFSGARAPILALLGRWDEAATDARAALDASSEDTSVHLGVGHEVLGSLARARGALDDGWRHVHALLPSGSTTVVGTHLLRTAFAAMRLAIALALDAEDSALAAEWLAAFERWLDWSGAVQGRADHAVLLARYHGLTGNQQAARDVAMTALRHASSPRQPLALIAAHRTLGEQLTAGGQPDEAERHLRESLTLAAACSAPFERALTLLALAELNAARGDTNASRRMLAEVRAICEPLDARPTLERVAALERRLD